MHKDFYVSGFLYHSHSQQILLQQDTTKTSPNSPWFLFGGLYSAEEKPEELFKKIILNLLNIKLAVVRTIYSYFDEQRDKNQYLVYSKVPKTQDFPQKNGLTFEWFTFKEILKLPITEQTKHDIVVGQRVIEAASRKQRGEHTFQ